MLFLSQEYDLVLRTNSRVEAQIHSSTTSMDTFRRTSRTHLFPSHMVSILQEQVQSCAVSRTSSCGHSQSLTLLTSSRKSTSTHRLTEQTSFPTHTEWQCLSSDQFSRTTISSQMNRLRSSLQNSCTTM